MSSKFFVPFLMFVMKYFFDVEKEITQQLLTTLYVRAHDCKELVSGLHQVISLHR